MQRFNKTSEKLNVHIRWMIRRDMPEVLAIEKMSFESPWSEEDFLLHLRQRNHIGVVAEHDERVAGFMVYELHKDQIHVLDFAVRPDVRRRHVGKQMVDKLVGKLSRERRCKILLKVRETNLAAQLFFRNQGFNTISVLKDYYNGPADDAYCFALHVADLTAKNGDEHNRRDNDDCHKRQL